MKLKASERRLLIAFLSLFAVIVGGFGTTWMVRHFGDAAGEVRALSERRDSLAQMLSESELWGARSAWIDEQLPTVSSREDASTRLLDAVSQKAEAAGVSVGKKELLTDPNSATNPRHGTGGTVPDSGGTIYFDRVAVNLELSGGEEAIFNWLHGIQQPGSFLGITHLTYVPNDDGVRCSAQVSFWFRESPSPNLAKSP